MRQDGQVTTPASAPRSELPLAGINWYDGWRTTSVGPVGFWQHERPADHFRTASGATGLVARMLLTLLADRPEISTVVDIGAGDGRLLAEIGALAPRMRLIGLDLRPAPEYAAATSTTAWLRGCWDVDTAGWLRSPDLAPGAGPVPLRTLLPAGQPMVVVAAEWLDDLPLVVAERVAGGWCQVRVGPDGTEAPGSPVPAADAAWLDRWWPAVPGSRAESGRTRDRAWTEMIDCLAGAGGLAVMIDYGHRLPDRPTGGTLTGFQRGRQVPPKPSAAINLTAHVAVDSVQQAGEDAGATTELVISQREAVELLLAEPARTDRSPAGALARLQADSERRLLADTLGGHWWLVQSVRPERRASRAER